MFKSSVIFNMAAFLLISLACKTVQSSEKVSVLKDDSDKKSLGIPDLQCSTGEPNMFILEKVAPMPEIDFFKNDHPQLYALENPAGLENNVRLDLCLDEDTGTAELKRLVRPFGEGNPFEVYDPLPADISAGKLVQAIMNKNYQGIFLKFFSEQDKNRMIYLKGWNDGQKSFVSLAYVMGGNPDEDFRNIGSIVLGDFVYSDFPNNSNCEANQWFMKYKYFLSTLTYEIERCEYNAGGLGHGKAYNFVKINVSDNSPALPEDIRGKVFTFTGKDFTDPAKVKYQYFHHNSCDFLVLYLPQAIYAFRHQADLFGPAAEGVPVGICPKAPDAPSYPNEFSKQGKNGIYYQIRYGNNQWQKGVESYERFDLDNTARKFQESTYEEIKQKLSDPFYQLDWLEKIKNEVAEYYIYGDISSGVVLLKKDGKLVRVYPQNGQEYEISPGEVAAFEYMRNGYSEKR